MCRTFVDTRLIDLYSGIQHDPAVPLELAKVQNGNAQLRGHLLAFNDEFVWRRLKNDRPLPSKARLRVRCMACGCVASLREWYVASTLPEEKAKDLHWRLGFTSEAENIRWLLPCTGERAGLDLLRSLEDLAGAYRAEEAKHA